MIHRLALALTVVLLGNQSLWSQAESWRAGIVKIQAKGLAAGTGFVVALRPNLAIIVTSAHVVEGDNQPEVRFHARESVKFTANVRAHPPVQEPRGIALLYVSDPPPEVRVIPPQSKLEWKPSEGTPGSVAGYPMPRAAFSVLPASVSSYASVDLIVSAATGEGFSGGPVLIDGKVAGMIYAKEGATGLAVSAAAINIFLRQAFNKPIEWGTQPAASPAARTDKPNSKIASAANWNQAGQVTPQNVTAISWSGPNPNLPYGMFVRTGQTTWKDDNYQYKLLKQTGQTLQLQTIGANYVLAFDLSSGAIQQYDPAISSWQATGRILQTSTAATGWMATRFTLGKSSRVFQYQQNKTWLDGQVQLQEVQRTDWSVTLSGTYPSSRNPIDIHFDLLTLKAFITTNRAAPTELGAITQWQ